MNDEGTVDIAPAEQQLRGLARRVPQASRGRDEAEVLVYLLANRAVSLYEGLLHSMKGPSTSTPIVEARSLVELAIRLKWVTLDPAVNAVLYFGGSEDADLKALRALEQNLGVVPPAPLDAATVEAMKAEKVAIRDGAKALAAAQGRKYGTRVMPDVVGMVREIESQDPPFALAFRQAYDDLYREFSAWAHSEVMSFKHFVRVESDGSLSYLGDGWGIAPEHLRVMAASTFALVLEVMGTGRDPKLAQEARAARDRLTQSS